MNQKGYWEQLPNFFFLRVEILDVFYTLEALRHNNMMPELLPGWIRKDIEQLPNFYPRSAQAQLYTIITAIEFAVRKIG